METWMWIVIAIIAAYVVIGFFTKKLPPFRVKK